MKSPARAVRGFKLLAVSAWLFAGCENLIEPAADQPEDMSGVITAVRIENVHRPDALAEILIEEDPSVPMNEAWVNQPNGFDKVEWKIMDYTKVYRQQANGSLVLIGVDELHLGSTVRAWHIGGYVYTIPAIAYAEKIIVVPTAQ